MSRDTGVRKRNDVPGPRPREAGSRPVGLSVDLDSVASHLEGYGLPRLEDDGAAYRVAVPRLLDLLDRHDARATIFLIASEARSHPEMVDRIVERGHEVASHSLTHGLPFGGEDRSSVTREVRLSRLLLQELSGRDVEGFRCPAWDLAPGTLEAVADAGYAYDASLFPSRLLPLLRRAVERRGTGDGPRLARLPAVPLSLRSATVPASVSTAGGRLVEIPVCTVPGLPLPYYHTLRYLLPEPVFGAFRRLVHAGRASVTYGFHAVDFLGLEEDGLPRALARHPGMELPLREKLDLAEEQIAFLGGSRPVVPLRQIAAAVRARPGAREGCGERPGGDTSARMTGTLHWI